ncbi:MAG: hypothetical protein WC050_02095 [Candidatus Paceibacterota bacterium]
MEKFENNEAHIRIMDDYAQMKNAVYLSSEKVLHEMVELHQLEEKHLIALQEAVQEKLIRSAAETIPELQAEALKEVKRILKNYKIEQPKIENDFAETLRLEMKVF